MPLLDHYNCFACNCFYIATPNPCRYHFSASRQGRMALIVTAMLGIIFGHRAFPRSAGIRVSIPCAISGVDVSDLMRGEILSGNQQYDRGNRGLHRSNRVEAGLCGGLQLLAVQDFHRAGMHPKGRTPLWPASSSCSHSLFLILRRRRIRGLETSGPA